MRATVTIHKDLVGEYYHEDKEYRFSKNGHIVVRPKGKESIVNSFEYLNA